MNYASIKNYDTANGEGIRVTLFVCGCPHHCKNCFNPETWAPTFGEEFTKDKEDEIIKMLEPDYIDGLTLLGGEPLFGTNKENLIPLLRKVKYMYPEKTIWCYTGYTFDDEIMNKMINEEKSTKEFLSYIDVLVDGRFVDELKSAALYFRGSSNQRIIDVQKSLKDSTIIEYTNYLKGVNNYETKRI